MNLELSTPVRRRAGLAIENTHKEYVRAGGLRELQDKAVKAEQKSSTYIYALARHAFESPNVEDPDELFNAMCRYAEEQFKTKHSVENVKDAIPPWATFKSNINRGIRLGLKPNDYPSEWEFRKAVAEEANSTTGSANRSAAAPSPPANEGPKTLSAPQADDWIETTTIHKKLRDSITNIVVEAEFIRPDSIDEAREILADASRKLAALIDRRRVRDPATKKVMSQLAASLH